MNSTIALFPGSFDPLTNGHVDIIERTLTIFPKVIIGVLTNLSKSTLFSPEERITLIKEAVKKYDGKVEVKAFSGLLADFARREKVGVVVRGLRAISDYDYESQMALINKKLFKDLETIFFIAREENSYISSTVVKQIALLQGDVASMVPKEIATAIAAKCKS